MSTQSKSSKGFGAGRTESDLFEETRMSFGEHLEELRKVLIKCLIWIAIGTAIGLYFADRVLIILQRPLNVAIAKYEKGQAKNKLVKEFGWLPPESDEWLEEGRIPQKLYVDPAEMVLGLREVNEDFFGGIEVRPYQFRSEHFTKDGLRSICQTMAEAKTDSTRMPHFVFGLLAEDSQAVVRKIASNSNPLDEQQISAFVEVMNLLLESRQLITSPELNSLFGSEMSWYDTFVGTEAHPGLDAMRQALEKEFDPILNRRLNRLIINRVFRTQMPALKMDLVPIVVWREIDTRSQSLSITEPFMIWFKAGLITGVFLVCPMVFYQIWSFVAAGLYRHEKKYVHLFLPISLALFLSGLLLAYFFVFDPVLQFLFTFNASSGIAPQPRINDWLGFVLFLPLGFGVAFQLPLVMLFLNRIGILSVEAYLSKWRIAIMVIFVLSMFLTPADPISMLLMAIPLTFLYFLGVGLCHWMPQSKSPFADEPLPTV